VRNKTLIPLAMVAQLGMCVPQARALDHFEIQVYQGDINLPGKAGLELHSNVVATRQSVAHGLWRNTLEPSLGVFPWWEIGAYFQMALAPSDAQTYFGGFKLRSKFILPPGHTGDFILGLNLEVGRGGAALGEADWDMELRPIVTFSRPWFLVAFNPILGWAITGDRHAAPDFEPAAKALWNTQHHVGIGLEYYAGLGPLFQTLPVQRQEHVLYLAADLIDAAFELNLGVGRGLTDATDPWVLKMILGLGF
jgi:hypothetical protein